MDGFDGEEGETFFFEDPIGDDDGQDEVEFVVEADFDDGEEDEGNSFDFDLDILGNDALTGILEQFLVAVNDQNSQKIQEYELGSCVRTEGFAPDISVAMSPQQ